MCIIIIINVRLYSFTFQNNANKTTLFRTHNITATFFLLLFINNFEI